MEKIRNKDLIQSYVITTARYDFSVYEKRILYGIIESLQEYTAGRRLNKKYVVKDLFGDYNMSYDISMFLNGEEDKNYNRVKAALMSLSDKSFEYEDDEVWEYISIITSPKIVKGKGKLEFRLHHRVYDAFLDFSKGFRKYELYTAMQFESIYSMRFYELFSNKTTPIIYSIDDLKQMFKIEGRYKLTADFFRYVVDPAKRELDKISPYSFAYEKLKTGRKFTHIKFKPYLIEKNRDNTLEHKELAAKTSIRWEFNKKAIELLKAQFNFTEKGINNNRALLKKAFNDEKIEDYIASIQGMIRKYSVQNKPGFFISEIKKRID